MLSHSIVPILARLCPCFLQFLSTSFLLPYLLIKGTPQRWRIIPVRSSKSFMSWEDMLGSVLPASFPLHGYLHRLPSLALSHSLFSISLPRLLLPVLVVSPVFLFSFIKEPITSARAVTPTAGVCLAKMGVHPSLGAGAKRQHGPLWMFLKGPGKKFTAVDNHADRQNTPLHCGQNIVTQEF